VVLKDLRRRLRSLNAQQISVGIGLLALLGTLAYNGWSIRQQTQQSKDAAVSAEAVLLTTLNDAFNKVDERVGTTHAARWFCDKHHGIHSLPYNEELRLWSALNYNDWLAWLIENDRVGSPEARAYWTPRIRLNRRYGYWFLPREQVADRYPALASIAPSGEAVCP
jgi:hypothetical protein